MTTYLVPAQSGDGYYEEKRSRFLAHLWPVESEAEALEHIAAVKKEHYDARHNCFAYILREGNTSRYSDDGEPQGTAGQPILAVLNGAGLQNVCCVVTRYFGGVLLGTGGLVRAYTAASKDALVHAGIAQMALWKSISLCCSYAQFERVQHLLGAHEAVIEHTDFGCDVAFRALLRDDALDSFSKALTNLTSGTVACIADGECFRGVRIK